MSAAAVRMGLSLPVRHRPVRYSHEQILALGELADAEPRWSELWVADSLLALPFLDSGVVLAALAARTRRIRLAVGCLASLGLRHPVTVARQWADLDALSGGRMTLVACPGNATGAGVEKELRVYRLTHTEKVARFEESVRLLRTLSTGGRSFRGDFVEVDDLDLGPGFVQSPLPIWIAANPPAAAAAGTVDRLLARVARLGDGWLTFGVTPELLARRVARLRELRDELRPGAGAEPFAVAVYLNANVDPVPARAWADARERWSQTAPRGVSADDLVRLAAIGSPEQAADLVGRLVDAGATHLAVEPLSTDVPRQAEELTGRLLPLLDPGTGGRPAGSAVAS
jgi:alkanesulfonate monooxygenase SsuD/methylene tetrahydromethanopterin reductase-like flavin-dependent oxidoreductase (luciferase family)